MSLKGKLYGNAAIYFAANILNAGVPFLLLPVLTRVLAPDDYGLVAMFGLVVSVMSALVGFSVHGVIGVRYFQLNSIELAGYIGSCVGLLVGSTVLVLSICLAFGHYLIGGLGLPIEWLLIAALLSGFQFLINIRLVLWQVSGQAKKYAVFQVAQSIFNALLSLTLVLLLRMAWEGRALGQIVAGLSFGLFSIFLLFRDNRLAISGKWRADAAHALRYGIPLIPHALGSIAITMGDRFIVGSKLGMSDAGIYMTAVQINMGLALVYDSIFKSWHPEIMKLALSPRDKNDDKKLVLRVYKLIGVCFVVMACYSIVAWFSFPYIVGHAFLRGQELIVYMAIASFFSACYYSTAIFIMVANRNELLALNTFISGLLSLSMSYFLAISFGLVGVAVGLFIGQFISFILCWYASHVAYPLPWLRAFR